MHCSLELPPPRPHIFLALYICNKLVRMEGGWFRVELTTALDDFGSNLRELTRAYESLKDFFSWAKGGACCEFARLSHNLKKKAVIWICLKTDLHWTLFCLGEGGARCPFGNYEANKVLPIPTVSFARNSTHACGECCILCSITILVLMTSYTPTSIQKIAYHGFPRRKNCNTTRK